MPLLTGDDLVAAMVEIREDDVRRIVQGLLDAGVEPQAVVERCREAMGVIGQRFEEGLAFIPELIMATSASTCPPSASSRRRQGGTTASSASPVC